MTGWLEQGLLARVRGVVAFAVFATWLVITATVIRLISDGLRLGGVGQRILWAIAIGGTLWGIFRIFKASAARSRAEVAALSSLSSAQMDVLLSTRPDLRWPIVRETALRMFREKLAANSRAELDEMLKGSPELADEARAELQRRKARGLTARIVIASFICVPYAILQGQTGGRNLETSEIARRGIPATVTILSLDATGDTIAQGSGFVIRSNGTVITNWHVLEGASKAIVVLASGETFRRVVYVEGDSALDIAIIKFPGFNTAIIPTARSLPEVGSRIVAIGSPLGLSRTVSEGIVSAVRIARGRQMLQMSAPISPGSSGGPVLDAEGRVVAIATSYLSEGQQINFAVPVRYALGLLEMSSTTKEVAEVFSNSGARSKDGESIGNSSPRAASVARSSLSGSYELSETAKITQADGSTYSVARDGWLFLGPDDLGLFLIKGRAAPSDSLYVMDVVGHSTTSDGRIAVETMMGNYAGYQTDAGFSGDAVFHIADGRTVNSHLVGRLKLTPLTENNGVYEVAFRTTYKDGDYTGKPTDWTGYAVVATSKGEVTVQMSLKNGAGGTTGLYSSGPLSGNSFDLKSSNGSTQLTGTVYGGRLYGQWIDRRQGAARYEGVLTGRRQ